MPTLNATETIAKSEGGVYEAPLATGVPADLTTLDVAWSRVGYVQQDSLSIPGLEGELTSYFAWDIQIAIRTKVALGEAAVELGLLQWNHENIQKFFPGSTIDGVSGNVEVPRSPGSNTDKELLVVVVDGSDHYGFWFARTSARPNGPLEFPDDELSALPVAFDILDPGAGSLMEIVGAEAAA